MKFTKKLIVFTLANAVVLSLANALYPEVVVFGNIIVGQWQGLLTTAFGITLAHVLFEPIAEDLKVKYHENNWVTVYLAVNAITIYLLARTPLSNSLGFGVAAFWVSVVLGVGVTIAQYVVWNRLMRHH